MAPSDILNTFRKTGTLGISRSAPYQRKLHYWSTSLVSQVTNLQASESLGSSLALRCPCVFWRRNQHKGSFCAQQKAE